MTRPCPCPLSLGPSWQPPAPSCSSLPGHGPKPSSAVRVGGARPFGQRGHPPAPGLTRSPQAPNVGTTTTNNRAPSVPPRSGADRYRPSSELGAEGRSPSGLTVRPAKPRRVPASPAGSASASAGPRRRPGCQPFCKLKRPPPAFPPLRQEGRCEEKQALGLPGGAVLATSEEAAPERSPRGDPPPPEPQPPPHPAAPAGSGSSRTYSFYPSAAPAHRYLFGQSR